MGKKKERSDSKRRFPFFNFYVSFNFIFAIRRNDLEPRAYAFRMCVFWKFHLLFKQIVCALKAAFSLVNVFVLFDIFRSRHMQRERENERKFYLRFALTSKCLSLTKIVYDIETHKQQFERISLVFIAVRNISKSGSDQRKPPFVNHSLSRITTPMPFKCCFAPILVLFFLVYLILI